MKKTGKKIHQQLDIKRHDISIEMYRPKASYTRNIFLFLSNILTALFHVINDIIQFYPTNVYL